MTAQEAGGRSGLGWVILVAALAVPGFLFYNWSSRLKAEHDRTVSAKARGRVPDGGVFQTPPAAGRLVNPIAASTGAAAGAAPATAASAAAPRTTAPALPVSASAAPASGLAPSAMAATTVPSAGAPAAALPTSAAKPALVAISTAAVVLPRDPLISPLDLVRIREAQEEEERRRRLLEQKPEVVKKHVYHPVERKIDEDVDLQGIVTTPDGRPLAIVNNETLGAGEVFSAPGHPGQVKIVSISADTVVFSYKNKRFKKVVTTE